MIPAATTGLRATSLLMRWDPRLRIIGLLLLSFSFSAVTEAAAVALMLAVTLFFWSISPLPLRQLLHRLRLPSLLIVLMVIILPVSGGQTPLLTIGFLTVTHEGVAAALLIASRFYCILILAILFLGCTPLLVNIRALQAIGLPYIVADMALLMVRYLDVLSRDLKQMRRSMQMRGHDIYGCSWTSLRILALLAGNLLLRSYERAQGVYMAMRLRGYGQTQSTGLQFVATTADKIALIVVFLTAAAVFWSGQIL